MDPTGIEPVSPQCECGVLPLYYKPPIGEPRIELGLYAPKAHVLPLYDSPIGDAKKGTGLPATKMLLLYYTPMNVIIREKRLLVKAKK